jgi:AcrR family transcriptional regulator
MPAAQRRETILRAAMEVFAEAGYRAAKVSDIAARVGVTEPVVFQNFGSKAALFAAVLEHATALARVTLLESAGEFGSAAELLRAHVLAGGSRSAHGGVPFGALFADATALASDPAVADSAARALRALAAHLADIIQRGQADGSLRADIDPGTTAWLLLSVLSAAPLRGAAMPPDTEPALADLLTRLLAS